MSLLQQSLLNFDAPQYADYEILRPIARGGHSTVFLAEAREGGRRVAIKRWTDPALRRTANKRIQRELTALKALRHPNIVGFQGLVKDRSGQPSLVMDYVPGESLAQQLERDGPLNLEQLRELIRPLLSTLEMFKEAHLVHRDIKPANVIVRASDAQPVVVDFSIVKLQQASKEPAETELTGGEALGTQPYMAPEQCRGAQSQEQLVIDHRTDLYGLGALVFHSLTGVPPWRDESAWERLNRNPWRQPWPLNSERREQVESVFKALSKGQRDWLECSMEGATEQRFQSLEDMRRAFDRAFPGERVGRPRGAGMLLGAFGLLMVLALGVLGAWTAGSEHAPSDKQPATETPVSEPVAREQPAQEPSEKVLDQPSPRAFKDSFCRECGQAYRSDEAFCVECGKKRL